MASKITLALLVVAMFAAVHQAAASTIPLPEGGELADRPWIPITICLKGSNMCERMLAISADDMEDSMVTNGMEPIVLNVDDEDFPMTSDDFGALSADKLDELIKGIPFEKLTPEEIQAISMEDDDE